MDFIKGIIGLAVLSGPLWLIVLAIPVALVVAVMVANRAQKMSARVALFTVVLFGFFLVLFGDEIAGRMYLNHLCETEAGVKVYQTVELPAEYWDEQGRSRFYDEKNGNFSIFKEYSTKIKIEKYSSFLHVDKFVGVLENKDKGLISENSSYRHWGGWIRRNFSPNNTATSCPNYLEQYGNFIKQVFKPSKTN